MGHDETASFEDLFHRHREAVHAFLLGRLGDAAQAADLLQETFLRAWRHVDHVTGLDDDRQRAWLVTVARNLVVDTWRAAGRRPATPLPFDDREPAAAGTDDPVARAVSGDDLARVDAAIAALPDDLREVLVMTAMAGMTSAEIAAATGVPAGTVRSRLHDARQRLATALA